MTKCPSARAGTPGVTERVCVSSAQDKWTIMLWDQEEVHPSDKQDGSLAYKKYGGTHLDLSVFRLGENSCFMSYIILS